MTIQNSRIRISLFQGNIDCVPCPPGQMVAKVRDGVTCVVMTTTAPLATEKPCPEGLVALMISVGRSELVIIVEKRR